MGRRPGKRENLFTVNAMRRSSSGIESSLDLLLDTICNTFGGVLFIALLVCLMTRESGTLLQSAEKADEAILRRHQWNAKKGELDLVQGQLAVEVANQKRQADLVSSLADVGDRTTFSRLIDIRRSITELDGRIEHTRKALADTEKEKVNASIRAAESQRKIEHATAEEATASRKEQEVRDAKTVRLRLPMARHTLKRQVGIFLSDGRLRMPRRYSREGIPIGIDRAVVKASAPDDRVTPLDLKPNAGFVVTDTVECRTEIINAISSFDKDVCYMILAVWPDSYTEFRVVRDTLAQEGFDYQLLLLGDHDPIVYGPGGPSEVQ